jgi:molecular chaperone DnaK
LGQFNLTGIAPAPRGMPQVEVSFDIDANGILNVSAKDKATGKEQSIRIEGSSGLSKDEVERMKKEAAEHAAEDERKVSLIDARNTAEHQAHEVEKQLKEHGEKIPADERGKIESAVSHLREVAKGDDADAIKKATSAMLEASQAMGKIIYEEVAKQQAAAGAGGSHAGGAAEGGESEKADDVIDADFEVKESK